MDDPLNQQEGRWKVVPAFKAPPMILCFLVFIIKFQNLNLNQNKTRTKMLFLCSSLFLLIRTIWDENFEGKQWLFSKDNFAWFQVWIDDTHEAKFYRNVTRQIMKQPLINL